jgi:hypothetical protein
MNHAHIDAHDIRSRYAAGRLTGDEETAFEAHLVDCPDCIESLECEAGLRAGLRAVNAESAGSAVPSGRRAGLWTVSPRPWLLQAAAVLLVASAMGLGVWLTRSSADLRETRAARDEGQRRAALAEASVAALQRELADVRQRVSDAPAPQPPAPVVPAAVFALTTVRGSSSSDGAPVNRVRIGGNPGVVVLSLDVPGPGGPDAYTVTLKDRAGRVVWSGGTFPASSPDSLGVAIDPALLPAGDYTLELGRRSAAGVLTSIGRYPFRVTR